MKKIFSIIGLVGLGIISLAFAGCDESKYLRVGISPDYAPYEFYKDNKIVGADVSFAKYLAEKLDLKLKLVPMEFKTILLSLQTNKIDIGISGFTYTEERAENFLLTDTYFLDGEGAQGILIKKDNLDTFGTMEKLNKSDVKVAAQFGSFQYELVKEHLGKAKLEAISKIPDAVSLLKNGNYDALAIAETVAKQIIEKQPDLIFLDEKFESESSPIIGVINKNNLELYQKVNEIIKEFIQTDLFQTWLDEAYELTI